MRLQLTNLVIFLSDFGVLYRSTYKEMNTGSKMTDGLQKEVKP